jgi:hypothetical protein
MPVSNVLEIPELTLQHNGSDSWRVGATVEGHEVYFESSVPLSPRPEALVCAFLLPAMSRRAGINVRGPLDARFIENLEFVRRRAVEWWPELGGGEVAAAPSDAPPRGPHYGAFYTGGVDSSYLLQQLHKRLRWAVFVEGFDIPLGDSVRLARSREWLSATAQACGIELLVIRTNLREHPLFQSVNWEITHGAALAAVAHTLGQHVHTQYIAASDVPPPWGSAPDLDAAWSTGPLKIENFGWELSRLDRVRSIARWERLRGRLRVCWENNTSDLNCGYCEKCARTRVQLLACGAPDGLDSFPSGFPLAPAISRLSIGRALQEQWREVALLLDDPELRREIARVLP